MFPPIMDIQLTEQCAASYYIPYMYSHISLDGKIIIYIVLLLSLPRVLQMKWPFSHFYVNGLYAYSIVQ